MRELYKLCSHTCQKTIIDIEDHNPLTSFTWAMAMNKGLCIGTSKSGLT